MIHRGLVAIAASILLVGCSESPHSQDATSSFDTTTDLVADSIGSNESSTVIASTALGCAGLSATPPEDFTVLFDSIALPTSENYPRALQTSDQGTEGAGRLFAKTGLVFKPGHPFELIVPEELQDRLSIGWSDRSWRVTVGDCEGFPSDWVALPGGYYVADPMCAELIVRSGATDQRVLIGLGAPCPGQAPPSQPSDL